MKFTLDGKKGFSWQRGKFVFLITTEIGTKEIKKKWMIVLIILNSLLNIHHIFTYDIPAYVLHLIFVLIFKLMLCNLYMPTHFLEAK